MSKHRRKLLVGYRFSEHAETRTGADGSLVVEAEPIAGPVYLEPLPLEGGLVAVCKGCQAHSKPYVRLQPALMQWVHHHRCRT